MTNPNDPKIIRDLIARGKYVESVEAFHTIFPDWRKRALLRELLYLKRIGGLELTGRDLVHFRRESTRTELITMNFMAYISSIDHVLDELASKGIRSPMNVLREHAPTLEELILIRETEYRLSPLAPDGRIRLWDSPLLPEHMGPENSGCYVGVLFERFPDPIRHCRLHKVPEYPDHCLLWTSYEPSAYIDDRTAHPRRLRSVRAFRHKRWGSPGVDPDFTEVSSLEEIVEVDFGIKRHQYTGRSHKVSDRLFFEVDLFEIDGNLRPQYHWNPFVDLVEDILREAENQLREKRGLPPIGDGWISESRLFALIKEVFPEAVKHASPIWLRPQHLDVYLPTLKIAFEYQGRQHFDPIPFFGGTEGLRKTQERDQRKRELCSKAGVTLITWIHDEPIEKHILDAKLAAGFWGKPRLRKHSVCERLTP